MSYSQLHSIHIVERKRGLKKLIFMCNYVRIFCSIHFPRVIKIYKKIMRYALLQM